MYQHCEQSDAHISLHDCHAAKIQCADNILTFFFEDGFWITGEHPENPTGNVVRTDRAEVRFELNPDEDCGIGFYVFSKRWKKTVREEWNLSKLLEHINEKNCTLEFLYVYKGSFVMIVDCWLWSKKAPYSRECELRLPLKQVRYCWNNLCEDRAW